MRQLLSDWTRRVLVGARRLARDSSGTTMIEFAAISAPLFGLFVAILQISITFFAQQLLETAVERAVRQLVTGQAQQQGTTQAQFQTLMCGYLPSFMPCSNLMVQVTTANNWSSVNAARPTLTYDSNGNVSNSWSYTPGKDRSINVVQAMYIWNVQSGPLGFDISNMSGGRRLLYATSIIQTEPYQ